MIERPVEPGTLAQPGRVLLTLAAGGPLRVQAAVDEKHVRRLAVGQRARAVADADPAQPFEAVVDWIAPAAVRDPDGPEPWVLVLRDGRAVRVPVKLGLRGVGQVELTDGVSEGALLIPQTEKAGHAARAGRAARDGGGRRGATARAAAAPG
ncbi:MAG: efflux RND transporter periplasmic adaptor subunit [Tepidimonas sp.]|nr:efflux RND transporter periplasmic adaptor subunit [Tepidimonas sp.]